MRFWAYLKHNSLIFIGVNGISNLRDFKFVAQVISELKRIGDFYVHDN
jgi:hypothetical protein